MAGRTTYAVDFEIGLVNQINAELASLKGEFDGFNAEIESGMADAAAAATKSWDDFFDNLTTRGQEIVALGGMIEQNVSGPIRGWNIAQFMNAGEVDTALKTTVGAALGEGVRDAVAAAGAEQILLNQIVEQSATSARTSLQVAQAQTVLARGGFSVDQVLNTIPTITELSIALDKPMKDLAELLLVMETSFKRVEKNNVDEGYESLDPEMASAIAKRLMADHSDMIVTLLQSTPMDFGDFSAALPYILAPSAIYGISEEEMLTGLGLLAKSGIVGEKGGTTLRRFVDISASPNSQEIKGFEEFGIDATRGGDFVDERGMFRGLRNAMEVLERAMDPDQVEELFRQMFQSDVMGQYKVRAGTGAAALLNAGTGEFDNLQREINVGSEGDRAAAQRAYQETSMAFPLVELLSKLEALGVKIQNDGGGGDIINSFIEGMSDLVDYINGLDTETLKLLTRAILSISIAGPGLLAVGSLFLLISAMSSRFTLIVTAATAAGIALFVFYERIESFWNKLQGLGQSERAQRMQFERVMTVPVTGDGTDLSQIQANRLTPLGPFERPRALSEQVYDNMQAYDPSLNIKDLLMVIAEKLDQDKADGRGPSLTPQQFEYAQKAIQMYEQGNFSGTQDVLRGINGHPRVLGVDVTGIEGGAVGSDVGTHKAIAQLKNLVAIELGEATFAEIAGRVPLDAKVIGEQLPLPLIAAFQTALGPVGSDGTLHSLDGLTDLVVEATATGTRGKKSEMELKLDQVANNLVEQATSVPEEIQVLTGNLENAVEAINASSENSARMMEMFEGGGGDDIVAPAATVPSGPVLGPVVSDPMVQFFGETVEQSGVALDDFNVVLASGTDRISDILALPGLDIGNAANYVLENGGSANQAQVDTQTKYGSSPAVTELVLERLWSTQILGIKTPAPIEAIVNMPELEAKIASQGLETVVNGRTEIEGTVTLGDGTQVSLSGGTATMELGPKSLAAMQSWIASQARYTPATGQSTGVFGD